MSRHVGSQNLKLWFKFVYKLAIVFSSSLNQIWLLIICHVKHELKKERKLCFTCQDKKMLEIVNKKIMENL